MKLNTICDGFGYKSSISSGDYEQFKSKKSRTTGVNFLRENGKFVYSDTDNPDDFIFVEPIMKAVSLPIKPVDFDALSTFEGASIIYGFTLRDDHADSMTKDTGKNVGLVNELINKLEEMREIGWPSNDRSIELNSTDSFKRFINSWGTEIERLKRVDKSRDTSDLRESLGTARQIFELLNKYEANSFDSLIVKLNRGNVDNRNFNNAYANDLQYAFAKTVKSRDADPEIYNKFLNLSSEVFLNKSSNKYDIILYPKSSKSFNVDFSNILSSKLSIPSLIIPKVKVKDVSFNLDELKIKASRTNKEVDSTLNRVPTDDEWAERELRKLRHSLGSDEEAEATIHNTLMGNKRRYMQLFGFNDPDILFDKSILVIDDNVAHQGTFEMVHALLLGFAPSSINLFTPLLLKT